MDTEEHVFKLSNHAIKHAVVLLIRLYTVISTAILSVFCTMTIYLIRLFIALFRP